MSISKIAILVCGVSVLGLFAAPVLSQQRGVGADGVSDGRMTPPAEKDMMFFMANGTMKKMKINATGHTEIMKNARALADGVAVYHAGGKFYLVDNKKMADGKMMFDSMAAYEDRQAIGDK